MNRVDIVPASSALWPQIAELFAAGGDPTWCWCQWQVGARYCEGN